MSLILWNKYCLQARDTCVRSQRITETMVCGTEAHIPYIFSLPHSNTPCFSLDCSRSIKDREAAYKMFCNVTSIPFTCPKYLHYTRTLSPPAWSMHPMYGGIPSTQLFWTGKSQRFRFICLPPLKLSRSVACSSVFYRLFHAICSSPLANCLPLLFMRDCIQLFHSDSPLCCSKPFGSLMNSGKRFPLSVFPPYYDLNAFSRRLPRTSLKQFLIMPLKPVFNLLNFLN